LWSSPTRRRRTWLASTHGGARPVHQRTRQSDPRTRRQPGARIALRAKARCSADASQANSLPPLLRGGGRTGPCRGGVERLPRTRAEPVGCRARCSSRAFQIVLRAHSRRASYWPMTGHSPSPSVSPRCLRAPTGRGSTRNDGTCRRTPTASDRWKRPRLTGRLRHFLSMHDQAQGGRRPSNQVRHWS
jgi:hypothetical protein